MIAMFFTSYQGTSPHARGPLGRKRLQEQVQGNIPACAGTTAALQVLLDGALGNIPACAGTT